MRKRTSTAVRYDDPVTVILDAARDVVAERGLAQLSLRIVAERAGLSVGTISYRIGDRAALMDSLAEREAALAAAANADWADRIGSPPAGDAAALADLVTGWLRDCAGAERRTAIVQSELASAAYRDPALADAVSAITESQVAMWRALLAGWPNAARLAERIACYTVDERPFSILLDGIGAYALLRASTIRALLHGASGAARPGASQWHLHLVDLLGEPARAAWDAGDPPRGARATIADRIADLIVEHGLAPLSHRLIAQAMAMPASSVAHHFPTQRDLLLGGVETLYLRLRSELRAAPDGAAGARPAGSAVVALGHEMALGALREPAFLPFAIDMRRRRAENAHPVVSRILTGDEDADRGITQAYVMAMVGMAMGARLPRIAEPDFGVMLERL